MKDFRLGSNRAATLKLAATPSLFGETRQPDTDYLLIPKVYSENRDYIPIGFMPPSIIASGSALIGPNATVYQFGLLTSRMHNAWMRAVAGRMEMRYQYSKNIVYNNFIAPTPKPELVAKIEEAAQAVLDVRAKFKGQTLANLYNALAMPPELVKAHEHLDMLVDKAYGRTFASDAERVAHLFNLYAQATRS